MKLVTGKVWAAAAACALSASVASAGPIIIDGTDANDHGSFSGGNQNGWLYMQKALENLGSQFLAGGGTTKTVVSLGQSISGGTQSGNAISSAFTNGTLSGSGWSLVGHDGAGDIGTYLSTISTSNTGILFLGTAGNSLGDMDSAELGAVNANAAAIAAFVNSGGALFAMSESGITGEFGWLTTLIPGLVVTDVTAGGVGTDITLTAAGTTAFPGLTNAAMAGADPWHDYFGGTFGSLSVLGVANDGGGVSRALILGGGIGGQLSSVPEPASLLLVGSGFLGLGRRMRNRRAAKRA